MLNLTHGEQTLMEGADSNCVDDKNAFFLKKKQSDKLTPANEVMSPFLYLDMC